MNARTNAQLWLRGVGHLNKRSLELIQRRDDNGVAFDGSLDHCDVCAVGKSHQLTHPKKAKHADITAPFQLVYGDLMGAFKPAVCEGYEYYEYYMSNITDQVYKWTAAYLLCIKDQAPASLHLFVTSTVIPFGSRIVTWRADKGGKYIGEDFKAYFQETGITQWFAACNTPQQTGASERVGWLLCAMVRCVRVDSGLPPFHWGELMMAVSYICKRVPHSALNTETSYKKLYGKDVGLSHLMFINAMACVRVKHPTQARPRVMGKDGVRLQQDQEQLIPHLEPQNASRGREQKRRFYLDTTKSASRGQAALAATRSRVTIVRLQ